MPIHKSQELKTLLYKRSLMTIEDMFSELPKVNKQIAAIIELAKQKVVMGFDGCLVIWDGKKFNT